MQNLLLRFLVSTPIQQIWHNASFDFRHIHYYTNQFPPNYDDSQILAKTLINHVETYKAKTGLKELAGYKYGSWGISADNFSIEQMYEPHVLKYAATDACATFWLWSYLQDYLKEPRNG
jgi:ribonuclease D